MSDKENILLDPAEMDKIENMPEIKTVSEEDLPAESEVKEQFEEKPENYEITVRDVRLSAGAGFVVAYTGDIMTMPGLPKKPAAYNIDCDNEGNIYGLF